MEQPKSSAPNPMAEAITNAVRALHGALSSTKFYHSGHPAALRVLERFLEHMNQVTSRIGPVEVVPSYDGIRWAENQITREGDDEKGLGYTLHREGIAVLRFLPEIELEEASRLVDALATNFTTPEHEEETLESVLWQAQLENIEFEGVGALVEAEALSSRPDRRGASEVEEQLEQILGLDLLTPNSWVGSARVQATSRDTARVATSEGPDLEPEHGEFGVEKRDLVARVCGAREEDSSFLERTKRRVAAETEADLAVRSARLLLLVALAHRAEFTTHQALHLAQGIVDGIYTHGNAGGILSLASEVRRLLGRPEHENEPDRQILHWFAEALLPPLRVAALMAKLDYTVDEQRTAAAGLVANLGSDGLLTLLQTSADGDFAQLRPFYETVALGAEHRIPGLVAQLDQMRDEVLVPMIRVLRLSRDKQLEPIRAQLLNHRSVRARKAAVEWFLEAPSGQTASQLVQLLLDQHASIRRMALDAMGEHRSLRARQAIEAVMRREQFARLSQDQRTTLCEAYAKVGREGALPLLERLFRAKIPRVDKEPVLGQIEAAAKGLLTIGTARAMNVIQREAAAWTGPRRQICRRLLREAEKR